MCNSFSTFANGDGGASVLCFANDGAVVGLHETDDTAEKISEIIKEDAIE